MIINDKDAVPGTEPNADGNESIEEVSEVLTKKGKAEFVMGWTFARVD